MPSPSVRHTGGLVKMVEDRIKKFTPNGVYCIKLIKLYTQLLSPR